MEKIEKMKAILIGMMLVAVTMAVLMPSVNADATHTELEFKDSIDGLHDFDVRRGSSFTVGIYVTPQDGKYIGSISTDLIEFSTNVMNCTDVAKGNLLTAYGGFELFSSGTINNGAGEITDVWWSKLGADCDVPGYYVNITFTPDTVGTGYVNITEHEAVWFNESIPPDGDNEDRPTKVTYNATIDIHWYEPAEPTSFTATAYNRTAIDLSWDKGTSFDADYTIIEYSESSNPWAMGEGSEIYNGTGTSYQHTGLVEGKTYYYQAWSYNATDWLYSTTNASDSEATDENQLPIQSSEDPTDNTGNVDKAYSQVSIDIADPEGDLMDYTIEGQYVTNVDISDASNGTYTANLITPLPYDTNIIWYVNVTDGIDWTNATYNFTVRSEYSPEPPTDFTATTIDRFEIDLDWTPQDDYTYIERYSSETWVRGTGEMIYNGTSTPNPGEAIFRPVGDALPDGDNCSVMDESSFNHSGGALYYESVDEEVSDGATTYLSWPIGATTDADRVLFNLSGIAGSGTIYNVTLHAGISRHLGSVDDVGYKWLIQNTSIWASEEFNDTTAPAYTERTYNMTTNPLTSEAWTWDDISNLKAGIYQSYQGNNRRFKVTQYWVTVSYENEEFIFEDTGLDEGTQYFYQAWSYNTSDAIYSSGYVEVNNITVDDQQPILSNENPIDDTGDVDKDYTDVEIDITDPEGDLMNWTIEGQYVTNENGNGDSNGTIQANLITPLPYDTNIIWYVNVTDGYEWTNETYNFTVRSEYFADTPTNFVAWPFLTEQLNLSWNAASGADKYYVEVYDSEGWSMGTGSEIYNSTFPYYTHSSLDPHTTYYYQVWSWNETDGTYSATYLEGNGLTGNTAPSGLTYLAPENESYYLSVYDRWLNVTATDADGDNITVYFYWGNGTAIGFKTITSGASATLYIPDYWDPDWLEHVNHQPAGYEWYVVINDTFADGEVTGPTYNFNTSKSWDINEDMDIDIQDISLMTNHYNDTGFEPGEKGWDINNDADTNILDVSLLVNHYGENYEIME